MRREESPDPKRPSGRARLAAALLLLPGLLATTACGGEASAGNDDNAVTVMTWAPENTGTTDHPGMIALAQAIARELDATGGLSGRKLRVLTCDEHNTADGASSCARQAVDAHVLAVLGSYSQYGGSFMPVLEAAGIPFIGGYGLSTPEFASPLSYPVEGGLPALIAGNGRQLVAAGCRTVALIRPDTRAGDTLAGFLSNALAPAGVKLTDLRAPEQSNNYSPIAARAIGDDKAGNCVSSALSAEPTSNLLDPYRRLAPKHTIFASVIGSIQQSVVDSTGGDNGPLGGAYATGWYPPESAPCWDALRGTVRTYGDGSTPIDVSDPGVETTWVAYEVFRQAVKRVSDAGTPLTIKALRAELDSGDEIQTGGATPPLSWAQTNMLASADSPRLVNTWVTFQQVQGGRLVQQHTGFEDVRWVLSGGQPPA